MEKYEKLLKKARKELPKSVLKVERFEVPKVQGHIQGKKTIINNFHQIAAVLHRKVEHLLKYVLKELAAPGDLKKNALIIGAKIPSSRINKKIKNYVEKYVICPKCKSPDTKLVKEKRLYVKCLACGAKERVKKI